MGGTQASSDAPSRLLAGGLPSAPGLRAVDEFRRTYFGSCRAGANALLDTTKDCRNDREAKVLDNIEGVADRMCIDDHRATVGQILGKQHVASRATRNPRFGSKDRCESVRKSGLVVQ